MDSTTLRLATALACLTVVGCTSSDPPSGSPTPSDTPTSVTTTPAEPETGVVTLAFAGDVHFANQLADLLDRPRGAVGPIARTLAGADLAMVNLESAIADADTPDPKELEAPGDRFYFRTGPESLDVLAEAGVDVVTMANNHGADHGAAGIADTLAAIRDSRLEVLGIGRNRREALTPFRVEVDGTRLAVFAADNSKREGSSSVWSAGAGTAGVADGRGPNPRALLQAVRAADPDEVVVVYLHWGLEYQRCPSQQQRLLVRALAEAGADAVVGSHSHVLQGSGWLGETYVSYGLGNFLWYHDHGGETGVLELRLEDGAVVGDEWTPAAIPADGGLAAPLRGADRRSALADWERLRDCAGLADAPGQAASDTEPAYQSSVQRLGPELLARMATSHRPGCPVPTEDLRYLRMSYRGFDGEAHQGEMVVHEDHAAEVTRVFRRLYDAGWPIEQMRLVDEYDGDDDLSMAANNTSAYNCRRATGEQHWSDHAFGAAIDLNPLQNPYVSASVILPPSGAAFAGIEREDRVASPVGVIRAGDVVVEAFAEIGWEWGGDWISLKDYQHFSARIS